MTVISQNNAADTGHSDVERGGRESGRKVRDGGREVERDRGRDRECETVGQGVRERDGKRGVRKR